MVWKNSVTESGLCSEESKYRHLEVLVRPFPDKPHFFSINEVVNSQESLVGMILFVVQLPKMVYTDLSRWCTQIFQVL